MDKDLIKKAIPFVVLAGVLGLVAFFVINRIYATKAMDEMMIGDGYITIDNED